tara:strand:+ start:176 stop:703 length:528 start_codon:yes stop_codon:yes gene_type:complete
MDLIADLINKTQKVITEVKQLQQLDLEKLNSRKSESSWSALECIEHLNRYGAFYIPEIRSVIQHQPISKIEEFKSGWLGNYFAQSILPKKKLNKMSTFKSMNPIGSEIDKLIITTFLEQQNQLIELLERSKDLDLNKIKTSISISKLIRLKLGDTFRVVIYHNLRHIEQAKTAVS